jgi:hypothetical protein
MKKSLAVLTGLLLSFAFTFPLRIKNRDLAILEGVKWSGKLTYLDYGSNRQVSIPADLMVEAATSETNTWYFRNEYPKEPHVNNVDTIVLKGRGHHINDQRLLERNKTQGLLMIVTQKQINDDGVDKIYQYTYLISRSSFSIKKEEKKKGDAGFIQRHVYEYTR